MLDALVREAILLEVPNFPLCSEECPGIRPAPDRALGFAAVAPTPVDPRLAPLGAFRKKLGGAATLDDLVAAAAERSAAMGRKPVLRSSARPTTKIPAAKKSAAKKPAANQPAANEPAANQPAANKK
ncbi:MAG: DUF177 domain-containing protein [Myxococcales bacterium]|nr:DUF177 domain-containing protein [Myxococcales bacterium]